MIRSWLGGCHQFLPPAEWEAEKAQSDGYGDDGGVVVLALCLVGHTVAQDWCSYCQMEPNLLQVTIHHSMIHAMNQLTRLGGTNLLSNAARHTHQSSAIRMAAEREGVHVAVSVSDDGPSECLSQPILSSTYRANESTLHLSALNISSPPVLLAAVLDQGHRGLLGASPPSPAVPTGPGGCGCASARRGCGAPAGLPVRPEPGAVAPARARPAAPGRRCWPAWA